jgi:hypothetical protein
VKKEKNSSGNFLCNCSKWKPNFTGSYKRVKAHFIWLQGDHGVHHCKKIMQMLVDRFQVEKDAANLAKEERKGDKEAISKRGNEIPLIIEESHERLNSGPLAKVFDMGGSNEMDSRVARVIFHVDYPSM